jgi:hypothetical protein
MITLLPSDADGAMDIIAPVCSGKHCGSSSILILFNKRVCVVHSLNALSVAMLERGRDL